MRKLESYKNPKTGMILLIVIFACIGGLFVFLFFNAIALYPQFDLEHSELKYEELTFDGYKKLRGYKSDIKYIVYFKEYETPFEISTISDKRLDKKSLDYLTRGEKLNVYYKESSNKKYDFVICEFSSDSTVLLSLSDYVETNQKNQIGMMILCPIMVIMASFLVIVFIYFLKSWDNLVNTKRRPKDDLGSLKIERVVEKNVVRVYNSKSLCTLVINNKVVDQYYGVVALPFRLSGSFNIGDRIVPVEAKMGAFYMKLYIDGKLVRSIFMGLG